MAELNRIGGMRDDHRSDAALLARGAPAEFGVFYDRHLDAVNAYTSRRVREP